MKNRPPRTFVVLRPGLVFSLGAGLLASLRAGRLRWWSAALVCSLSAGCTVDIRLGAPLGARGLLSDAAADGEQGEVSDGPTTYAHAAEAGSDGARPVRHLEPGVSWQWQLTQPIDTSPNAAAFDLDLFSTEASVIDDLHRAGRIVLCYFSAGTQESFRPDADQFDPATVGNSVSGTSDEAWIDVRAQSVRQLMVARLDEALRKGCDGVQPSAVDGFDASGFGLTAADETDYMRFLAREGHVRGLSVGLTNAVEIAAAVEPYVDWALDQECLRYRECDKLAPFVAAGKAVLHAELVSDAAEGAAREAAICNDAQRKGFSTIVKTPDLGAWRLACP